jgi:tripartite-type tricarboxylate transporter receptor subunit TctC
MKGISHLAIRSLVAAWLGCLHLTVLADVYPSKPIRIVAPFPPGGPADILSRTIGQKLSQSWGQPVVIDNRPGAGGNIGADVVAKSAPDGYTLLMGFVGTHAINPSLYAKMPFDNVKDFEPVARVALVTIVLVVNPSVPAHSLKELIALAKSKPGELTFGSPGHGTPQHLAGEMFNTMAGVKMLHVPYKGAVPALSDLLGGQVSLIFSSMPPALPLVKAGKLRALGVTSTTRSPAAPEIPTLAESGLPGYVVSNWYGILAPRGTPKEIVAKLNAEIVRILNLPDVKESLAVQGAEPFTSTPEQFAAYIKEETEKWAKIVKHSGVQLEY